MSRNNNRGRGEALESASRTNGTIRCAIYTRKSTDGQRANASMPPM